MTIKATNLPGGSALQDLRKPGDFLDCYGTESGPTKLTAAEAAKVAFGTTPEWVSRLMRWRNRLVAPLGLKTGPLEQRSGSPEIKVGARLGAFQVYSISDDEVIMGEDDKHLDFRVSVMISAGAYHIATWVKPHNIWGRLYLTTIMPFHKAIVKNFTARIEAHR